MQTSRRKFIQITGLGSLGFGLLPHFQSFSKSTQSLLRKSPESQGVDSILLSVIEFLPIFLVPAFLGRSGLEVFHILLVLELARTHDAIVTVEEGCVMGGAGSAVQEALAAAGNQTPVLMLGLPDIFIEHGDPAKLLAMCGLDTAGIEQSILKRFGAKPALVRAAVNS